MSDSRTKGRRSSSRAFRPALDGRLEDRVLLSNSKGKAYLALSQFLLKNTSAQAAKNTNAPPFLASDAPPFNRHVRRIFFAASQTIRGGQAVNVASVDGTHYRIQLGYISNTVATSAGDGAGGTYSQTTTAALGIIQPQSFDPQPIGTIRVYPMSGGMIGIIVDGSTPNTELTINPLPHPIRKGYAHSFSYHSAAQSHLLNIGLLTVNTGQIGAIEGFHTANLSGPLTATGTTTIDRIAFNSIMPGASIHTGGTVNTLDVYQGITLGTNGVKGTSIQIGNPSVNIDNANVPVGDLNLLNVGGNIVLENSSNINVGRNLGATLQPAKGTGTGSDVLSLNQPIVGTSTTTTPQTSVSGYIQGSINIDPTSAFTVFGSIFYPLYIIGKANSTPTIVGEVKSTALPQPFLIQGTTPTPVNQAPAITANPTADQTVIAGNMATFTAAASGFPPPTVQWQVSTNGGVDFSDIPGAKSTVLSFTATATSTGHKYRAVFTNAAGTATTNPATLTVTTVI